MMFLTVVCMLGGIAGMQYLALCEQRATQWRLDRVRAALTAYNDRRHVPPPETALQSAFEAGQRSAV